jgi:galactokinase
VELSDPDLAVLIANTNVRHELTGGEYAQRRQQCEQAARTLGVSSLRDATMELLLRRKADLDTIIFRRARHVISEIERTCQAAQAIRGGDWATLGQLMYASHASLRDDFEVSCRELDVVVDLAHQIGPQGGMLGCRMTGGGFGGCTVALVRTPDCAGISRHLATEYKAQTGRELSLFVSRPAGGARVLMAP